MRIKTESSIQELWGHIKCSNMDIVIISESCIKEIFKEIMSIIFQNEGQTSNQPIQEPQKTHNLKSKQIKLR